MLFNSAFVVGENSFIVVCLLSSNINWFKMVNNRSCSVKNCEDKQSKRHQFPDFNVDPVRFKKWVDACGNTELHSLDAGLIRRSRRVCHKHFSGEFLMANERISRIAVPTLYLPETLVEVVLEDTSSKSVSSSESNKKEIVIANGCNEGTVIEPSEVLQDQSRYEQEPKLSGCDEHTAMESLEVSPSQDRPGHELGLSVTPKKGHALLEQVGVRYQSELTPKARRLYTCAKKLVRSNTKLKKRVENRLRLLSKDELLEKLTRTLEPHVADFIKGQIKFAQARKNGRRYTNSLKILGLILYKQSPKCYKLIETLFSMPSKKTLMTVLKNIPITVGLNNVIFDHLRSSIERMAPQERVCVLMFDEMAIEPHVSFNGKEFVGFEDFGDSSSNKIADHALVFMLRSISGKWKQPLLYGFSHSAAKSIDIVRLLKATIQKCQSIGIEIIATISDQGSANVAAINYLMKYTVPPADVATHPDIKYFFINNVKIVHVYDPPHLLKGIRNNLINKKLIWDNGTEKLVACWDDIFTLYKMDNMPGEMRSIPKITDQHVNPNKIKKMKVSCAAQVFSHSVSSLMSLLVRTGATTPDGLKLPQSAKGTAAILKFFDSLFDSVNGTSFYNKKKELRCSVSEGSPHLKYWSEARKHLKNMYFISEKGKVSIPSLKNWVVTLNGLEEIFQTLVSKYKIYHMKCRNFNQDPIENFFGQIRQQGHQNPNPTPFHFQNHFKTLLINNITSRHSISANCENDNATIITNLEHFILNSRVSLETQEQIKLTINVKKPLLTKLKVMPIAYVCGWLCKYIKTVYKCPDCKRNVISENPLVEWHDFIESREYTTKMRKLLYCTPNVIEAVCDMSIILKNMMPQIFSKKNVFDSILNLLETNIKFKFNNVCEHSNEVKNDIIKKFACLYFHNWAASINKILNGNDTRFIQFSDPIMEAASLYYKHKQKK